jgi:formamidopyrimidine-DNA glycosylase
MPELPEVETTRRGIEPHVIGPHIKELVIRQGQLRWPIPAARIRKALVGHCITTVQRRGKYLLLTADTGTLIIHLGMSGSLRIVDAGTPADKHDHVDMVFANGRCLRFHDPRRFGAMLWTARPWTEHKLLKELGPEPLSEDFSSDYLFSRSRQRRTAIKQFIMDSKIVTGVGNIYASESLFLAGINPKTAAGRISLARMEHLVQAIKQVLREAIEQGGTTLRDFVNGEGKPGYFQQRLNVYGREGEPCRQCDGVIRHIQQGQRATYYCPQCQR